MDRNDETGPRKKMKLSHKPAQFKKNSIASYSEDFRNYLSEHGVLEYITNYFNKLKKERPQDPIKIFQDNSFKDVEIEELKRQLAEAYEQIEELKIQNKELENGNFEE